MPEKDSLEVCGFLEGKQIAARAAQPDASATALPSVSNTGKSVTCAAVVIAPHTSRAIATTKAPNNLVCRNSLMGTLQVRFTAGEDT